MNNTTEFQNVSKQSDNRRKMANFQYWLVAPFIYLPSIAFVILDLAIEIYQRVCFPIYGIPIVERKEYIRIDRQKLQYLTWKGKINCAYCGYANGLMGLSTEIVGRTEQFWCAIKHDVTSEKFHVPAHHKTFA